MFCLQMPTSLDMGSGNRDDVRRVRNDLYRSENMLRQLRDGIRAARTRLATLQAWIFDKETTGQVNHVYVRNSTTGELLGNSGWVSDRAHALVFHGLLTTLHYCRANRVRNAELLAEFERVSGTALIPVDLGE
jgi:hypothetical protein